MSFKNHYRLNIKRRVKAAYIDLQDVFSTWPVRVGSVKSHHRLLQRYFARRSTHSDRFFGGVRFNNHCARDRVLADLNLATGQMTLYYLSPALNRLLLKLIADIENAVDIPPHQRGLS